MQNKPLIKKTLLTIKRFCFTERTTIGRLYHNNEPICYTLEDTFRENFDKPSLWKRAGESAIPLGKYRVIINRSTRFQRDMPLLLNVPAFEGVRIHAGNTDKDTAGCILVGMEQDNYYIAQSREAFGRVMDIITRAIKAGEEVWVTLENAMPY